MKNLLFILLAVFSLESKAQINEYSQPVTNTLESYTPLPLDDMLQAAIIQRNAEMQKNKEVIANFLDYYGSIQSFKPVADGDHDVKVIIGNSVLFKSKVSVRSNRITSIVLNQVYNADNGLKVTSEIVKGHNKIFLDHDDQYIPIDVYILDSFQ